MVTLCLRDERGLRHEAECVTKVLERELTAKRAVAAALPVRHLGSELRRLTLRQRRRARRAGLTVGAGELRHHAEASHRRLAAPGTGTARLGGPRAQQPPALARDGDM